MSFLSPFRVGTAAVFLFFSCNKEEPIPSYIHIDKIDLTTNDCTEGSNAHKISDAWVYIDDNLVGAFEMPCTFPVLYEGSHKIQMRAGVKENGISETRIYYPFYAPFEQTVTLTRGQISTLVPIVKYSSTATFAWLEDFEGSSHDLCMSNGASPDTIMLNDTANVFEGSQSGKVSITGVNSSYFGVGCAEQTLPQGGANVFAELNYNCNAEFNIGVAGYTGTGQLVDQVIKITIRSTEGQWNKIYINLTNVVSSITGASKFSLFFSMLNQTSSTQYFYLDNVKLVN